MRKLALLMAVALGGCVTLSDTTPPRQTTVIVPQANTTPTLICSNGTAPPCL